MGRKNSTNFAVRWAAVIALAGVATFASAPLFAQARAEIQVSAMVLAPTQPTSVTRSVTSVVSDYSPTFSESSARQSEALLRAASGGATAAKSETRQTVVVTVEYAAN